LATQSHGHVRIKGFDYFDYYAFFGKLREHELEMDQLNEQEIRDKKVKGSAFKSSVQRKENSENDPSQCSDVETLNMLTRNFTKFMKKKSKDKIRPTKKYNFRKTKHGSSDFTCFSCGK